MASRSHCHRCGRLTRLVVTHASVMSALNEDIRYRQRGYREVQQSVQYFGDLAHQSIRGFGSAVAKVSSVACSAKEVVELQRRDHATKVREHLDCQESEALHRPQRPCNRVICEQQYQRNHVDAAKAPEPHDSNHRWRNGFCISHRRKYPTGVHQATKPDAHRQIVGQMQQPYVKVDHSRGRTQPRSIGVVPSSLHECARSEEPADLADEKTLLVSDVCLHHATYSFAQTDSRFIGEHHL